MTLIEGLWCISTLACAGSVVGMLYVYRSLEQSMDILTGALNNLIITQGVLAYGARRIRDVSDSESRSAL